MVAALVAFAACNKEAAGPLSEEGAVEAVFEVSAPELATKAISDGLTADQLFFFLYDKEGKLLFNTNSSVSPADNAYPVTFDKLGDKKWSVKVRLIKGMTYKLAFWAQKKMDTGNPFSFDADGEALTVSYNNVTMNSDNYDAFWGTVGVDSEFIVNGPATKVVTLKRPFAQLNVAIPAEDLAVARFTLGKYNTDADAALAAITTNYTLSSYAYNTMNLLDGTVSENAAETTPLTLVAQAQPNADITIGDKTYKHMAMAYILVGDKVTNNVTLTVDTKAAAIGAEGVLTRDVLNVPLQRNYRTNIIGNIFSVEEEFTVEVDNAFGETGTGAYGDVNVPDYVPTFGSIEALNAELAKGVNAVALDMTAVDGTINLPNTTEDIYLYILNDLSAAGNVLNVVYTEGAAAHPANLYIYAKNLNTLNGTVPDTHVEIYSYSHIGTGVMETSGTTLVIQPFAFYGNLIIKKGGLKVEGKVAEASLQPTNLAEPINVTIIKDAEKDINGQIVILDVTKGTTSVSTVNSEGGAPTVDPATVEADKPAVGTMTVSGGTATVEEGTTVTTLEQKESGQVIVEDPSDVANPIVAENETLLTVYVAAIGDVRYKTLIEAFNAVEDGKTILLLDNLTQDDGVNLDKEGVSAKFDLNGKTLTVNTGSSYYNRAIRIDKGTLEVYNGSIVAKGAGTTSSNGTGCYGAFRVESNGKLIAHDLTLTNSRPYDLNVKVLGGEAELTNVVINSSYGGGIEVTEADLGTQSKKGSATLTNCKFTQTGYYDHCSTTLSVSGGSDLTINSGTYTSENHALYVFSSGGQITVNDGTFVGGTTRQAIVAEIDLNTYPSYTGGLKLKAGNYTGAFSIKSPAYMEVTGGTFDQDPSAYVSEGYEAVLTDGKYVVDAIPEVDYDGISGLTKKADTFEVSTPAAFNHVLSTPAILKPASKQVTIKLTQDIDLSNQEKHTLNNLNGASYVVTLDGQGHTLKGLQEELFAEAVNGAVINVKNLTFDTVNINKSDDKYVAVIMGYADCNGGINVSNVTFKDVTLVGAKYIGVVYGFGGGYDRQNDGPVFMDSTIDGCVFENCSLATNEGSAGVVAGHVAGNAWTLHTLKNSIIKGCTVICNEANKAGVLFGTIGVAGTKAYGKIGGTYVQDCLWFNNSVTADGSAVLRSFGRVASPGGKYYIDGNLVAYNEGSGDVVSGDIYEKTE